LTRRCGSTYGPESCACGSRASTRAHHPQNNTSANVASASVRTLPLELSRSISPSTWGPANNPTATKPIAGVTTVPDSRPEIAATPSSVKATIASDHATQSPRESDVVPAATDAANSAISMSDLGQPPVIVAPRDSQWSTANAPASSPRGDFGCYVRTVAALGGGPTYAGQAGMSACSRDFCGGFIGGFIGCFIPAG
jgi:hypothetical protein